MNKLQHTLNKFFFVALVGLSFAGFSAHASAESSTKEELAKASEQALHLLYKNNPTAESIGKKAKAILIFPHIVKVGFVFGGAYGEGVLMKGSKVDSFYNSVSASWGLQAGAQSYGYVVFLMSDNAIKALSDVKGWSIGVDPSVVVVDEGVAKDLNTTTLKKNAYAFIFDQKGLMASLSIGGTKISHINPKP